MNRIIIAQMRPQMNGGFLQYRVVPTETASYFTGKTAASSSTKAASGVPSFTTISLPCLINPIGPNKTVNATAVPILLSPCFPLVPRSRTLVSPDETGHVAAAFHRGWMSIKEAMGNKDKAII
jgi:hypothetical protein